jgi:predicted GIY-YIG superfamily endonuclease
MHYVYVMMNEYGTVEYVGETQNIKRRFKQHTSSSGRFANRKDLKIEIVKQFAYRKEAREYEGELKLQLGFEWTEKTSSINGGKIGGKITGKRNVESGHLASIRLKQRKSKPIFVYRKDTGELVGEFTSQRDAARQLGLCVGHLNEVLSNKRTHTGGYTFKKK